MNPIENEAIEKLKNIAVTRCMERIERAKAMKKEAVLPVTPGITRLLKSRHGL